MKHNLYLRILWTVAIVLAAGANGYGQTDTLEKVKPLVTDVRELLTGQTPGTVVVSSMGAPWITPTVYIRGIHLYNENPLYFVDGVMVHDLGYLAPESIQSIEVISGPDAVMKYGPYAVNGALSVTTKKASKSGFHISYGFSGAVQQLAWEPKQLSLEEWKRFMPYSYGVMNVSQNPYLKNRIKPSFVQNHSLNLQYGGEKLSFAASLDYLNNDGPLEGFKDSKRLYSGNARVEYSPVDWLRLGLSYIAGHSDTYALNGMLSVLLNEPVKEGVEPYDPFKTDNIQATDNVQSGQVTVELFPLSGLSIRAFYGISKDKREAGQNYQRYNILGLNYDWKLNQYGLDSDYSFSLGKHSFKLGASFKCQDLDYSGKYSSFHSSGMTNNKSFLMDYTLSDLSSSIRYDWNKHLFLGIGIYQQWIKGIAKPLSPALAADIRWDSGKWWSLFGTWSQFYSYYDNSTFRAFPMLDTGEFSRTEAGADATFEIGGNIIDIRAEGFFDNDIYHLEDSALKIANSGLETSAGLSGQTGEIRYSAGASLTLYRNKVNSMYKNTLAVTYHNNLQVREGYPVGIAWLRPVEGIDRENGTPTIGSEEHAYGNGAFPTVAMGLHGSVGWKNWQFSVLGHGNFGQSIIRDTGHDALTRHYLENSWRPDHKDSLYPLYSYNGSWPITSTLLHKASFFRIDQIRLDYTLPVKRYKGFVNLFVSLENYFLFTSYPGSDPEYLLNWENAGNDSYAYPSTKRIVTGLKLSF